MTSEAEGRVVLVTGSTDGLGRATARELARRGATVLLHGRSRQKLDATGATIAADARDGRVRAFLADLASLEQVRRLAQEIERDCDRLDVLVNNAGVGGIEERRESADGLELHFAVNYLAPFLLTTLLLPLLRRSVPSRIVNVASAAQTPLAFDDLQLEHRYEPLRAYGQSKLAQILFTFELDERLRSGGQGGVTVNALHPQSRMDTKMVRSLFGQPRTSLEDGVEALLRLVLDPALAGTSGRYFDRLDEASANPQAYDSDARRRLWARSESLARCGQRVVDRSGPFPTGCT